MYGVADMVRYTALDCTTTGRFNMTHRQVGPLRRGQRQQGCCSCRSKQGPQKRDAPRTRVLTLRQDTGAHDEPAQQAEDGVAEPEAQNEVRDDQRGRVGSKVEVVAHALRRPFPGTTRMATLDI